MPEVIMRESTARPGGVVVVIRDGERESAFARVAWSRLRSRNPLHTFKHQLRDALRRAEEAPDA
jgi:hypothetical protein